MAVPKKRMSRSQRGQRRAHDAIKLTVAIQTCPSCGAAMQRHHVCAACGEYRGVKVFADNDTANGSSDNGGSGAASDSAE
jgi:large subunit ribosomal protein L32